MDQQKTPDLQQQVNGKALIFVLVLFGLLVAVAAKVCETQQAKANAEINTELEARQKYETAARNICEHVCRQQLGAISHSEPILARAKPPEGLPCDCYPVAGSKVEVWAQNPNVP